MIKETFKQAVQNVLSNKVRTFLTMLGIIIGVMAVIILGFVLMAGGGSDSPDEFNYAMFSWRRITLAPILVIGGFAFEIYAILKRW